MAHILLLVDSTGHASTTRMQTEITTAGHTYTTASAANYATQDYNACDMVMYVRVDPSAGYASGLISDVRTRLDGGKPMAIGIADAGFAATDMNVTAFATGIGLTGLVDFSNGTTATQIDVIDNSAGHPTEPFALGDLTVYTGGNAEAAAASMVGTVLAHGQSSIGSVAGQPALSIIESGTSYNGGSNTTGARCFVYGCLYCGQSPYSANGRTLFANLLDWTLASAGTNATATPSGVSGTGAVGSAQVNLSPTVSPTGVEGSGAVGTVTVSSGANDNATPSGVSATGSVGTVSVVATASATASPAGVEATGAVGSATVRAGAGAAPTGVSATGSVGSVTVSIAGDIEVAVTGVSAAGNVGTVTLAGIAVVASVSGVEAVGSVGAVTIRGWLVQSPASIDWAEEAAANDVWTEAPRATGTWSEQ